MSPMSDPRVKVSIEPARSATASSLWSTMGKKIFHAPPAPPMTKAPATNLVNQLRSSLNISGMPIVMMNRSEMARADAPFQIAQCPRPSFLTSLKRPRSDEPRSPIMTKAKPAITTEPPMMTTMAPRVVIEMFRPLKKRITCSTSFLNLGFTIASLGRFEFVVDCFKEIGQESNGAYRCSLCLFACRCLTNALDTFHDDRVPG